MLNLTGEPSGAGFVYGTAGKFYDPYRILSNVVGRPVASSPFGGPVGYYNSGFLSGLGGVLRSVGPYIAAAGSIAAEVLPAIYHTGTSGATQTPAAGPTGAPVMAKPTGTALVHRTPIQKIEQVLDPTQLGGPTIGTVVHQRYAPAGTKGYHPVKKGPHAGMWVRNRHRNVCNIRALRRSLSRVHGFEKVARKVVHFVHPKRAVGHAVFKRRRRS